MLFVIRRQSSHVNGRAGSILRLVLHAEAVLIDVTCKIGVALFLAQSKLLEPKWWFAQLVLLTAFRQGTWP